MRVHGLSNFDLNNIVNIPGDGSGPTLHPTIQRAFPVPTFLRLTVLNKSVPVP